MEKKNKKNQPVLEKLGGVLRIYSVKVDFNESDCMKKHSREKAQRAQRLYLCWDVFAPVSGHTTGSNDASWRRERR